MNECEGACGERGAGNHRAQLFQVSILSAPRVEVCVPSVISGLSTSSRSLLDFQESQVPGGALFGLSVVLAAAGFTAHTPQSRAA